MRQRQNDRGFVDDARDDQMPRAADLAGTPRNPAPAVSQVVVDAAGDDGNAGTFRVFHQIHQRLLDQRLISPPAEATELDLTPPQDVAQLVLRGSGEQHTAQAQAPFSGLRLSAPAPFLRMNARNASRPDSLV
jgi:hypothetical protein